MPISRSRAHTQARLRAHVLPQGLDDDARQLRQRAQQDDAELAELRESLKEKEEMLKYIEREVEDVKGLFDEKEKRLQDELEVEREAKAEAQGRLAELQAARDELSRAPCASFRLSSSGPLALLLSCSLWW